MSTPRRIGKSVQSLGPRSPRIEKTRTKDGSREKIVRRQSFTLSRVVGVAAISGALLASAPLVAEAATTSSAVGHYGSIGTNQARLHHQWNWAQAETVTTYQGGGAGAGMLGARGRLFRSSGAMQCEGGIWYNASNDIARGRSCGNFGTPISYFSYGVSWIKATPTSPYSAFYTFKTAVRTT